jgi:phage virion morphogenesis protein
MRATIEVDDSAINAAFARMVAVGESPRLYLGAIGNALVDNTRLRFRDSKAPDGSTWPPLSPVTIARRRGGSAKPLEDTGRTRNSITSRVTGDELLVGTNVPQGAMLHFGARKGAFGRGRYRTRKGSFPIPWGDVPPRPYLGISNEDRSEIVGILARAITGDKS